MLFTITTLVFCLSFIVDSFLEMKLISLCGIPMTTGIVAISISYIANDCLTEVWGFEKAKRVFALTIVAHIVTVLVLQWACWVEPAAYWDGEEHFDYVFGAVPRITIASIIAFAVGSMLNAWVMHKLKYVWHGAYFKTRAFLSTVAANIVDNTLFFTIAFFGLISLEELGKMILARAVWNTSYEVVVLPVTACVTSWIKRHEKLRSE